MKMTRSWPYCLAFALVAFVVVAADLRSDLREFAALVPRRRIGYIGARYYIFDAQFRQALEFVRSKQFLATWQQIRATPEFGDIIAYVSEHGSGFDVTSLVDKIPNHLRIFQISRTVPVNMILQRNLTTFLREVLQNLPRSRISNLMTRKVSENGDFAQLYRAFRSSQFSELITKARRSRNLKAPLSKLQKNYINVDEILELIFELISWGPSV